MSVANVIDGINRAAYTSGRATKEYGNSTRWHLLPEEQVVFRKILPQIRNRRILDIGIGGGRTTAFLLRVTLQYTGIDYSEKLIASAKKLFKTGTLLNCDARDMHQFPDRSFDFAMFSFNGIDYLPHAGRIEALREIHRVLEPRGLFLFSSHNRDWKYMGQMPWRLPTLWSWPGLKRCIKVLLFFPRHLRMRRFEVRTDEYEILNDSGLEYRTLSYYISSALQRYQLESLGFTEVEAYGRHGRITGSDLESPSIHYLARKG
jgi:ubiquinone/menaquinone biosynthesis C-methylase UbiE